MARYTLTARISGKVEHERFDDFEAALDALERRGHALQGQADAEVVGGSLMRRFEPEDQVTARLELSTGRFTHKRAAGIDVRGDGTFMPYRGGLRREELDPSGHDTPFDLVRETLEGAS